MVGEGEVKLVRGQEESWSGQPVSSNLRGRGSMLRAPMASYV